MIASILDSDLYKFSQQQAVVELFPNVGVTYRFTNRDTSMKFTKRAFDRIVCEIRRMEYLSLTEEEYYFLETIGFFKPTYLEYLRNYRFNPDEVDVFLTEDGDLELSISGLWHSTILWEVPLMAIISEVYFSEVDTDWSYEGQKETALRKARKLLPYKYAEFGTRRRRSYQTQKIVVGEMHQFAGFVGTSNVHLAMMYGVKPVGTVAHEFIMGVSALRGLRHANWNALDCWVKVYEANLGIALTDTYGTDAFFDDFDLKLSKTFDGVRHDSGCPIEFSDKVVAHYKSLKIDPATKTIIFSDGLNVDNIPLIASHCDKLGIRCSFGIGTSLTNDFKNSYGEKSKPLNMVIKLRTCDGVPVVKLSDTPSKATGDEDAVRVAKWTFFNIPLDGE